MSRTVSIGALPARAHGLQVFGAMLALAMSLGSATAPAALAQTEPQQQLKGALSSYVPSDAAVAVIIHPARIMTGPFGKGAPTDWSEYPVPEQMKVGQYVDVEKVWKDFDPRNVRRIAVFLGPPEGAGMGPFPKPSAIAAFQFLKDMAVPQILVRGDSKVETQTRLGKTFFRGSLVKEEIDGDSRTTTTVFGPWMYQPDPRLLLMGETPEALEAAINKGAQDGPLKARLKDADLKHDAIVEADMEAIDNLVAAMTTKRIDELLTAAVADFGMAGMAKSFKGLKGLTLRLDSTGDTMLRLAVTAGDEDKAGGIAGLAGFGLEMVKPMIAGQAAPIPPDATDEQKKAVAAMEGVAREVADGITADSQGDQAIVAIKMPKWPDNMPAILATLSTMAPMGPPPEVGPGGAPFNPEGPFADDPEMVDDSDPTKEPKEETEEADGESPEEEMSESEPTEEEPTSEEPTEEESTEESPEEEKSDADEGESEMEDADEGESEAGDAEEEAEKESSDDAEEDGDESKS